VTRLTSLAAVIVAVSVCCATVSVMAEDTQETQPAATDQAQAAPQMPKGHPPLTQENPQPTEGQPQLPQGHPPLPQGHPPVTTPSAETKVYETTEVEPAWRIGMRHLIIRPMESQLQVTEVWAVVNPTDKSYIGAPVEDPAVEVGPASGLAQDKVPGVEPQIRQDAGHSAGRTTLVLPLPTKASHIQFGAGFDACCVRVEAGKIISAMPMQPGTTELRVNYLLAGEHGLFDLSLSAPALTEHLMIFLPDDNTVVTAKGLTRGDPFQAGGNRFRMYTGKMIESGADIGLTIQAEHSHADESAAQPVGAAVTDNASGIKLIAGIGGGALLLAAVIVLVKPSKKHLPVGAEA
jgi:hypothetical protein